jgi:hypothetical protein
MTSYRYCTRAVSSHINIVSTKRGFLPLAIQQVESLFPVPYLTGGGDDESADEDDPAG